ncbi:phosphate signaling complex protein PhoU [Serpentinicella alkaliphila]|uniref:Phosphate-specific transport system accessory protein PhoU n=1 Tax=Serpentinicella alkaliphila TaxID=1734049 RepID=A0A4R2TJ91_9FIRM|nr:phosphate signaling complex protein PhoU [Serpentinicella alkaliphila]QUH25322.1 phosphate signaling complex protein PhoU [Serpentinicella alkaliphila]TCQ02392.1 PhoU-like phosphate uptake regulator [Serpentinicella alkaliphila]
MRSQFNNQLKDLNVKLIKMGAMVQEIIEMTIKSLTTLDLDLAKEVVVFDDKIDELELEIEMECMRLLALQQPMARDLRVIGTIMKIITDLERMGDNAVNISKETLKICEDKLIKPLVDIPRMAKLSEAMVIKCLDAFMKEDIEMALEVAQDDDAVDEIYERIYFELIEMMIEDPSIIQQATRLLFIGRYLERIADHATNIGERIIYMVTGELKEIN